MSRAGAVHLDAAEVAAFEREEFVREAVAGVSPVVLEHRLGEGQAIDLRLDAVGLGPLSVQSMRMSAMAARRTPRLAHDDSPPSLFVIAKRTGTSAVVQDGRETRVGPGDLVLLRSTQPSVVLSEQPTHQQMLQIPLQHLALPEPVLRQASALRLGPELPLASVLSRFIDSLTNVSDLHPGEAEHLARAAVDLVRGLVTTVQGAPRPAHEARDALDATMTLRLMDYLYAHWREHDLTANRLAMAHHISTRQLYRLLAAQGITLGDWLREQRLEASRDELALSGAAAGTIAGVGRRWGFPDATNFGRAFKASYGMTPLEWRRLHQTTSQP
ncbi:helix-turn-helix domain-containing protein [Micromonosporaceae bacterium Da 78-11]